MFLRCHLPQSNCIVFSRSPTRNISHYDVLGIKQDATSKEIKQAFFRKSKQVSFHFGVGGGGRKEESPSLE
uniref:J domain-containing protein n=1 Tax=Pseudonaja textilis TaxID=8673 RepID=A0A670ZGM1_PSETE